MNHHPVSFEYWKSSIDHRWYWHLKTDDNAKLAQGEAYATKEECLHAIELVRECRGAQLHLLTPANCDAR